MAMDIIKQSQKEVTPYYINQTLKLHSERFYGIWLLLQKPKKDVFHSDIVYSAYTLQGLSTKYSFSEMLEMANGSPSLRHDILSAFGDNNRQ